jgi:hypothetical protein
VARTGDSSHIVFPHSRGGHTSMHLKSKEEELLDRPLSLSLSLSLLSAAFLFFSVRSTHCSLSLSHPSPVGGACSLSLSLSLSPSLSHIHQQRVVHCLSHTSSAVRGGRSHIQSWCVMAPINEQWVVHLSLLHPSASRGGWHCLSRIHLQFGGSLSLTSISSARCSLSLSRIHH